MSEEREAIRREFPVELETTGDGRTVDVRIVPYNTPTRVADPPDFIPYDEEWIPGAFDKQLGAANRVGVFVNVEHEKGIGGIVGRCTELRDIPDDGLHGTFRMLDHPDADKALQLINDGELVGVSLEAIPNKTERRHGPEVSLLRRVKARLVNIALVRPTGSAGGIQAFKGAQVLAVRETIDDPDLEREPDDGFGNAMKPEPQPSGHVEQVLSRIGYEPLVSRTISKDPWDDSTDRFSDEEYERSCLLVREGDDPAKERCTLPVLEPNGDINADAIGKVVKRLVQTRVPVEQKAAAARKLIRYYRLAGMETPETLRSIASK